MSDCFLSSLDPLETPQRRSSHSPNSRLAPSKRVLAASPLQSSLPASPHRNFIDAVRKRQPVSALQCASHKAHLAERNGSVGQHLLHPAEWAAPGGPRRVAQPRQAVLPSNRAQSFCTSSFYGKLASQKRVQKVASCACGRLPLLGGTPREPRRTSIQRRIRCTEARTGVGMVWKVQFHRAVAYTFISDYRPRQSFSEESNDQRKMPSVWILSFVSRRSVRILKGEFEFYGTPLILRLQRYAQRSSVDVDWMIAKVRCGLIPLNLG